MVPPGTLLQNRYRIVRPLGQGGMGVVYEAVDQRLGHRVALKALMVSGAVLTEAFEKEARLLARLRHPALTKVSDYFVEDNSHYLVMEYVSGDNLEQLLERAGRPLPWQDVLRWTDQLLEALHYLHAHHPPVIHRDIKPSNLKLTPDGDIRLLDFGLAKGGVFDNLSSQERALQSVHAYTLRYASPEQINDLGTDERSDLYSLGATLYHLLTARLPDPAPRRLQMFNLLQPDPLYPVTKLNSSVPPDVAELILQLMALNPVHRPATAQEVRVALQPAATPLPPAPEPPYPLLVQPQPIQPTQPPDSSPSTIPHASNEAYPIQPVRPKASPDDTTVRPRQLQSSALFWLLGVIFFSLLVLSVGGLWWSATDEGRRAAQATATSLAAALPPSGVDPDTALPTPPPPTEGVVGVVTPAPTQAGDTDPEESQTGEAEPVHTATLPAGELMATPLPDATTIAISPEMQTATPPPTLPPSTLTGTQSLGVYRVVAGDTFYSIATKHNMTVEELRELNNLSPGTIPFVGQELKVPGVASGGSTDTPLPSGTRIHTVQRGEWFYAIARQYNLSPEAIRRANPGVNLDVVYVGQQIIIP